MKCFSYLFLLSASLTLVPIQLFPFFSFFFQFINSIWTSQEALPCPVLPRWNPRRISRIEGNFRLNWGDPLFLHVKKQHNLHISPPSPHIAEALQSTKLKLRKCGVLCWTFEKAKNPTTARTREMHQTWVSHIYPTKALWPYSFSLRLWQCHVLPIAWLCLSSPCSSRRRAWGSRAKVGQTAWTQWRHSDVDVRVAMSIEPCRGRKMMRNQCLINVSSMSHQCLHCLHCLHLSDIDEALQRRLWRLCLQLLDLLGI